MKQLQTILYWISFVLVIVGAFNWALVGVSPAYNLVEMIAKQHSRWVYYLVGLAAIYLVFVTLTYKSMDGGAKVPKGFHIMPDGTMMKDSDHMDGGAKNVDRYANEKL